MVENQEGQIYFLGSGGEPGYSETEAGAKSLERAGYHRCSYEEWLAAVESSDDVIRYLFLGRKNGS